MRRRSCIRHGIADALRQLVADDNALVTRQFNEAVSQIGIAFRERRLDMLGNQRLVAPQGGIDLDIGQQRGIVLCRQNGPGLAGMRPQRCA